ncbi:unnamed protein product [Nezara viridula]|uniref:Uncharacterized protein n=1 Tax=Nezara viridula TaxID=85310 RepID=A0A9P0MR67_NEZVI|nr:unnamed protein product [Nezara viridula]
MKAVYYRPGKGKMLSTPPSRGTPKLRQPLIPHQRPNRLPTGLCSIQDHSADRGILRVLQDSHRTFPPRMSLWFSLNLSL